MIRQIKEHRNSIILGILIVLWLGFIWGHSMAVADESTAQSGRILALINKLLPWVGTSDMAMFVVRKLAHFTEYVILGVLAALEYCSIYKGMPYRHSLIVLMSGLICAMIDETIQLFTPGRSSQVVDVWIDFGGVVLGTLIVLEVVRRKWYNGRNTD